MISSSDKCLAPLPPAPAASALSADSRSVVEEKVSRNIRELLVEETLTRSSSQLVIIHIPQFLFGNIGLFEKLHQIFTLTAALNDSLGDVKEEFPRVVRENVCDVERLEKYFGHCHD